MKPGAGDDLLDEDVDDQEDDADEVDIDPDELLGEAVDEPEHSLPWIHRRDTVKSDRPEVLQANVRTDTAERERELMDDVEGRLGEDVYLLDLREAALLVAMDRPNAVADQLREWGYDLE